MPEKYTPGNHPQPEAPRVSATDRAINPILARVIRVGRWAAVPAVLAGGALAMRASSAHAENNPSDSLSRTTMTQTLSHGDKLSVWDEAVRNSRLELHGSLEDQKQLGEFFTLLYKNKGNATKMGEYVVGASGHSLNERLTAKTILEQGELGVFFKAALEHPDEAREMGQYVAGVAGYELSYNDQGSQGKLLTRLQPAGPSAGTESQTQTGAGSQDRTSDSAEVAAVSIANNSQAGGVAGEAAGISLPTPDDGDFGTATPTPRGITPIESPTGTPLATVPQPTLHATATSTTEEENTPTATPTPRGITPIVTPTGTPLATVPRPTEHATATATETEVTKKPTKTPTSSPTASRTPAHQRDITPAVRPATPTYSPTPISIYPRLVNTGSGFGPESGQKDNEIPYWIIGMLLGLGVTAVVTGAALKLNPVYGASDEDNDDIFGTRIIISGKKTEEKDEMNKQ